MSEATLAAPSGLVASDWAYVGCSLFLGVCALVAASAGPYAAEWLRRRRFAPKLNMDFRLEPPWCHKTKYASGEPVYYFRLSVANQGKSQARRCETVVEELWTCDSSGTPSKWENFSPVRLTWVEGAGQSFVDINPHRPLVFCDMGHVSSPSAQQQERAQRVNLLGKSERDLLFAFGFQDRFFAQPDCLPPGKYVVKVGVYSENADNVHGWFELRWSGTWRETEQEMFREVVVTSVSGPKDVAQ